MKDDLQRVNKVRIRLGPYATAMLENAGDVSSTALDKMLIELSLLARKPAHEDLATALPLMQDLVNELRQSRMSPSDFDTRIGALETAFIQINNKLNSTLFDVPNPSADLGFDASLDGIIGNKTAPGNSGVDPLQASEKST